MFFLFIMNLIKLFKLAILLFFIYYCGFYLSKTIDYLFEPCDILNNHYHMMFEIVSEFTIAFIIYILINKYLMKKYSKDIYNYIQIRNKDFIQSLAATAFSYGIYKNLDTCFENARFLKNKFFNT